MAQRVQNNNFNNLIKQSNREISKLSENIEPDVKLEKERVKKIAALNKDISVLNEKLTGIDLLIESIGGELTVEESKKLVLEKHFKIINEELTQYLNKEKAYSYCRV